MILAAVMATGAAALSAVAVAASHTARVQTSALALAEQRLEQLRALVWTGGVGGTPRRSDRVADLSRSPSSATGRGLSASPSDALEVNRAGYADFLDSAGRWVGAGTTAPDEAVFVRRWTVTPAPYDPLDTVILRVRVTTATREAARPAGAGGQPAEVVLASVKTRKGR